MTSFFATNFNLVEFVQKKLGTFVLNIDYSHELEFRVCDVHKRRDVYGTHLDVAFADRRAESYCPAATLDKKSSRWKFLSSLRFSRV